VRKASHLLPTDGMMMVLPLICFLFLLLMSRGHGEVHVNNVIVTAVLTDVSDKTAMQSIALPPSAILKEEFNKAKKPVSEKFVEEVAKKALLSTENTKIWLDHLQVVLNNRRQGAKKAAETRARNLASKSDHSSDIEYYCGLCGKQYVEETETQEVWIACDMCDMWYCAICENVTDIPAESYICSKCRTF